MSKSYASPLLFNHSLGYPGRGILPFAVNLLGRVGQDHQWSAQPAQHSKAATASALSATSERTSGMTRVLRQRSSIAGDLSSRRSPSQEITASVVKKAAT